LWRGLSDVPAGARIVAERPGGRLNVGEIVAASTLSRSAVAHHLKVLREAGVLHSEKVGKEVWHRSDPEAVRAALTDVLDFLDHR
jgi:DNA-binding transcriptional ArsR family regulator